MLVNLSDLSFISELKNKVDFEVKFLENKTCDFLEISQSNLIHNHPIVFNNSFQSVCESLCY
ncbi:MAG: hypothetical protein BM555_06125 [Crocinitomix sp. MedPE-SWsnd]|nr:MAG: hypothetical protein BM555_06125 [Crocinitomix sp. MedPE-SWsnd]